MARSIAALALLLLFTPLASWAWESDVHYVLTWWLAVKAGFSRGDADSIARADQSFDDSDHHSAIPTVISIVLRRDLGAARDLQRKHFPSDAQLPSPAMRRVVTPNSGPARAAVEAAIRTNASATALQELGEGLHPFQDSWAHQGVPDVPLRPAIQLSPELSCAHPQARGGWWRHAADLTYLHVTDAEETAHATYALMLRYLQKNPRLREHPAANWTDMQPIVREFAEARTQADKNAWAVKYVPESHDFRYGPASQDPQSGSPTLPGTRWPTIPTRPIRPGVGPSAASIVPKDLVQRVNEFIEFLFAKHDVSAAANFIETQSLLEQFGGRPAGRVPFNVARWGRKVMAMYLVEDHAIVDNAGHGNPDDPRYSDLPEVALEVGPFRAFSYSRVAPISPGDFSKVESELGGLFFVAIQPAGLFHDALCLVWDQTANGWRITRMFPLVD